MTVHGMLENLPVGYVVEFRIGGVWVQAVREYVDQFRVWKDGHWCAWRQAAKMETALAPTAHRRVQAIESSKDPATRGQLPATAPQPSRG